MTFRTRIGVVLVCCLLLIVVVSTWSLVLPSLRKSVLQQYASIDPSSGPSHWKSNLRTYGFNWKTALFESISNDVVKSAHSNQLDLNYPPAGHGPAGGLNNLQRRLTFANKRQSQYSPVKKMLRSYDNIDSTSSFEDPKTPQSSQSTKPYIKKTPTFNAIDSLTTALSTDPTLADAVLDQFYNILEDTKQRVDIIAVNKLIKVLGDTGQLNHCRMIYDALLDHPQRRLRPTLVTFTTLISKAGNWKNAKLAQFYFDEMVKMNIQPDVQLCNSMMNAYAKLADIAEVTKVFHELTTVWHLTPTIVSFNTLIDAYARAGRPRDAQTVLNSMPSFNCTPNERSYSSLIHSWCAVRKVNKAMEVLRKMEEQQLRSSTIIYSTILHALGKQGNIDEAIDMMSGMLAKNIQPNLVTMSSLMHACGKHNRLDMAWQIYEQMLHAKVPSQRPNSITCSALIDVCLKFGEVEKALSVVNDMRRLKLPLTEVTYTSLITELTKLKQLDRILEFAMTGNEMVAGTNVIVVEDDSPLAMAGTTETTKVEFFPYSARSITSPPTQLEEMYYDNTLIIPYQTIPSLDIDGSLSTPVPIDSNDNDNYNNSSQIQQISNMALVVPFVNRLIEHSQAVHLVVDRLLDRTLSKKPIQSNDMAAALKSSDLALFILRSQQLVTQIMDSDNELQQGSFQLGITGDLAAKLKTMSMTLSDTQANYKAMLLRLADTSQVLQDCQVVISGYTKAKQLLAAADIIQEYQLDYPEAAELPIDQEFYARIGRLLLPQQGYQEIIGDYEELTSQGIVPDSQLYGKLMTSVYEQSKQRSAGPLLNQKQQLRQSDLFRLYLVFQEMRSKGIEADAGCYNTLINACADVGDIDRALETMQAMQNEGIAPDVITYTSLIKACANSQEGINGVRMAEEIFDAMQQRTNHFSTYIAPTTLTLQWLMRAHIHQSATAVNTTRIWELLDDTMHRGFAPTTKMYRYCLNAAIVDNDVEKALAMVLLIQRSVQSTRVYHTTTPASSGSLVASSTTATAIGDISSSNSRD